MAHTDIFNIQELLEEILHFLAIDKSLYPALFVCRHWYRCGAPILWRRVELKKSNTRKIFMKIIRGEQKPVYSSSLTHLEISHYYSSSDKKFKKDIEAVVDAKEKLLKLSPVTYNWKRSEFPEINFQDIIAI